MKYEQYLSETEKIRLNNNKIVEAGKKARLKEKEYELAKWKADYDALPDEQKALVSSFEIAYAIKKSLIDKI